jgi:hypothetical protein
MRITLTAADNVVVDLTRRTITGTVYRYDEVGRTSAGPLRVGRTLPAPPVGLALTLEHDRGVVRGSIAMVDLSDERLRVACRVADGPLGDAALAEAANRTRAGLSFDLEDAEVVDGVIVAGTWAALGQVENPAFNSARIDQIAASNTPTPSGRNTMRLAPDQAALLVELKAKDTPTDEEKEVIKALEAVAAAPEVAQPEPAPAPAGATAPEPVAASAPRAAVVASVPAGIPTPQTSNTTTAPQGGAFGRFCYDMAKALHPDNRNKLVDVTAALADVTYSSHAANIQQPDWSGELWSGLEYQPEFLDLFTEGTLTSLKGTGWRFTSKLEIADYAGDKAEIPTDNITTETQDWTGARMAVGVDIDRAFFDFPTAGFIESLFQQVRESWKIKLDAKVRAYTVANAAAALPDENAAEGVGNVAIVEDTLLKAAAVAVRSLKRRRVGAASWVLVSDEDMFTLLDTQMDQVLAYLKLFNIDPEQFRSSSQIPAGTVYAGVKPAAKVRTMPGSPIRVDAQRLTHGGVDEAFFGYWAIEEQHTRGIAKATFTPA